MSDYMLVYKDQKQIENIKPDFKLLSETGTRGIIVTSKGKECDFVSRFFGPGVGIDEDPVTGSAHTTLIPYWQKILGKNKMTAMQLSKRKGYLRCTYLGERVEIGGKAKTYLIGEIETN
jgi:predicted PhzF superfamily epimerase YddE/YHI9